MQQGKLNVSGILRCSPFVNRALIVLELSCVHKPRAMLEQFSGTCIIIIMDVVVGRGIIHTTMRLIFPI